jgi:hypothetical protein
MATGRVSSIRRRTCSIPLVEPASRIETLDSMPEAHAPDRQPTPPPVAHADICLGCGDSRSATLEHRSPNAMPSRRTRQASRIARQSHDAIDVWIKWAVSSRHAACPAVSVSRHSPSCLPTWFTPHCTGRSVISKAQLVITSWYWTAAHDRGRAEGRCSGAVRCAVSAGRRRWRPQSICRRRRWW